MATGEERTLSGDPRATEGHSADLPLGAEVLDILRACPELADRVSDLVLEYRRCLVDALRAELEERSGLLPSRLAVFELGPLEIAIPGVELTGRRGLLFSPTEPEQVNAVGPQPPPPQPRPGTGIRIKRSHRAPSLLPGTIVDE